MAASKPPLVVLVHGAFHGAWCWAALQAELDTRGLASIALDLPGHGTSAAPPSDLLGDAAAVRSLTDRFDGPIVLVGHSYGGAVITEAATGAANVGHLLYVTAFVLDKGETVYSLVQSLPKVDYLLPNAMAVDGTTAIIDPASARAVFYGECDPAVARAATARLDGQPLATFSQPATNAAWKSIPSTFVRCLRDQTIPIAHQDVMAQHCGAVETLDTDHSPFTSRTTEVADIIERIVVALDADELDSGS